MQRHGENAGEVPLSWFGRTLWRFTPFYVELVFVGALTLGQLIAFPLIAEKIAGPISNFSSLWESWQDIRVLRQRLGDIVNTPTEAFGALPLLPATLMPDLDV